MSHLSEPLPDKRDQRAWSLYRCKLNCKIGRDCLDGKTTPPGDTSRTEFAIFNLLHAVEDLAEAMRHSQPHSGVFHQRGRR